MTFNENGSRKGYMLYANRWPPLSSQFTLVSKLKWDTLIWPHRNNSTLYYLRCRRFKLHEWLSYKSVLAEIDTSFQLKTFQNSIRVIELTRSRATKKFINFPTGAEKTFPTSCIRVDKHQQFPTGRRAISNLHPEKFPHFPRHRSTNFIFIDESDVAKSTARVSQQEERDATWTRGMRHEGEQPLKEREGQGCRFLCAGC